MHLYHKSTLMKKELYVHIPTPCHEDWQQMTPVDKGRFCQSCAKQVVDFSLMTDQEVLNYLSKASGNLCGRFANDQLQRPLQPIKQEKKKFWWMAAMLPVLMLVERGNAQNKSVTKGKPAIISKTPRNEIMGRMVAAPIVYTPNQVDFIKKSIIIIRGKIVDKDKKPVPFASIMVDGEYTGTEADSTGIFELANTNQTDTTFLDVSAIGYKSKRVYLDKEEHEYTISLQESENVLSPVTITSFGVQGMLLRTGGLIYCTTIKITAADTIRQILSIQPFKVYPNPATRGSKVTIDIKTEGAYSIQLFDNNGRLLQVQEFEAVKGSTQTAVTVPSSVAAGMYYIRLVNDKTKKQYTDKIEVL